MVKNLAKKYLAVFTLAMVMVLGFSTAAFAATDTLKTILSKSPGESFSINGTYSNNNATSKTIDFTVTNDPGSTDEDAIKNVKQGMDVKSTSGGSVIGQVLTVDYSTKVITIKYTGTAPSGTSVDAFFVVPDNAPNSDSDSDGKLDGAATNREHTNNSTTNVADGTDEAGTAVEKRTGVSMTSGPHGKFVSNTNACGRCHQLHAAQSSRLIRFKTDTSKNTIYGICTYCHSFNGQSTYDVRNGQIWDTNDGKRYATNGGGFENMLVVEGKPSVATYAQVTARHAVDLNDGTNEPVKFTAPGGKPGVGTDGKEHVQLKCTACHQPHGTANDRLLVEMVDQGGDVWYSYAPGGTSDKSGKALAKGEGSFTGISGPVKIEEVNPFGDETSKYNAKIVDFCAQCHVDYAFGTVSSLRNSDGSNDGTYSSTQLSTGTARSSRQDTGFYDDKKYRHMMAIEATAGLNAAKGGGTAGGQKSDDSYGFDPDNLLLPLAKIDEAGVGKLVCTTCHYAHGTFTNNNSGIKTYDVIDLGTEAAKANYKPSGTSGFLNVLGGTETAKNLRLDDRGVCQNCHNRNPDETKPSLIGVLQPSGIVDPSDLVDDPTTDTIIDGSTNKALVDDANKTVVIRFAQYMRSGAATGSVEKTTAYTLAGGATVDKAKLQPDKRTVVIEYTGTAPTDVTVVAGQAINTNGIANDTITTVGTVTP